MADVFMSYSSQNGIHAKALCEALEKERLSVWIAPRNIPAGSEYGEEIIKGIEASRVFLLCLSKDSVQSQHVLREVERAVNRNMTIIVYQMEEVTLTKSLEYFLASTQWFIPEVNGGVEELVRIIRERLMCAEKQTVQGGDVSAAGEVDKRSDVRLAVGIGKDESCKNGNKGHQWRKVFAIALGIMVVVAVLSIGLFCRQGFNKTPIEVGQTFTFGALHLQGIDMQPVDWMVLSVDDKAGTALCITEKIVAFGPYDGAESATRGQSGETYYQQESLEEYTAEQLRQFWGSSDWETSSVRTWLNSEEIDVKYDGQPPTEDATSLYDNEYVHREGFLQAFTEEEKRAIVPVELESRNRNGEPVKTTDRVYLLSKNEAEQYFTMQNKTLLAVPTQQAENADETGIYAEYKEQGILTASWGLRECGDIPACTVLCAGSGMSYEEDYHSEYACSSLMGIRPVMCVKLDAIRRAIKENAE